MDECDDVDGLPFGVVPYATACAGDALSTTAVACDYAADTAVEIAYDCPAETHFGRT